MITTIVTVLALVCIMPAHTQTPPPDVMVTLAIDSLQQLLVRVSVVRVMLSLSLTSYSLTLTHTLCD